MLLALLELASVATATAAALPLAVDPSGVPAVATATRADVAIAVPVDTATRAEDAVAARTTDSSSVALRGFGGFLELLAEGGAPVASSRFDGIDHHGPFASAGARAGFSTSILDASLGVSFGTSPVPGAVWTRQSSLAGLGLTVDGARVSRAELALRVEIDVLDPRTRVHVLAGGVLQIEQWRFQVADGASARLEHTGAGPVIGLGLLYRLAGVRAYVDFVGEVAVRGLWYGERLTATDEEGPPFADDLAAAMSPGPFALELGLRVGLRFGLMNAGRGRASRMPGRAKSPPPVVVPSDGRSIPIR